MAPVQGLPDLGREERGLSAYIVSLPHIFCFIFDLKSARVFFLLLTARIRCLCGAEWCYGCGVDWTKCICDPPYYLERLADHLWLGRPLELVWVLMSKMSVPVRSLICNVHGAS
jgi:hypothetical protein